MSIYSDIEVLSPNNESQEDKNSHIEFGHGIHWSYQIAVAGGKRIYQGVQHGSYPLEPQFEDISAVSLYEQRVFQALKNYQTAISACMSAIQLKIPEQEQWLREDLEYLFEAEDWFRKAWLKIPDGIVRLDWYEYAWGMSEKDIAQWDSPNGNFANFVQLSADCKSVLTNKLTPAEFAAKYSGKRGGASEMEIEP